MSSITMKGNPLTLEGNLPEIGKKAPAFHLLTNALKPCSSDEYCGKVIVLVTVPSLDTGVCDMEVRRFNKEAASLSDKVRILAVSMDLPFAQARWCGAAGVTAVTSLSDHFSAAFGKEYGVLIKELRLLARAVFVINAEGILTYSQLVPEMTQEPDYDAVLAAIKKAL